MSLATNPTAAPPTGTRSHVGLLLRSVFIENIRRREFYVLLLFMALFLVGALVVRLVRIENAATATFLLNLGLTLAFSFAKIITVLTAARQFPEELEKRTLYPLLAKPLGRGEYLLGKWTASVVTGVVTLLVLFLMAYLPVPHLEEFSAPLLVQMLALEILSLCMLAALAILLSLIMPHVMNVVVLGLLVVAAPRLINLVRNWFFDSPAHMVINWITGYIPDFSRVDVLQRFTDGLPPLSMLDLLLRVLYACAITIFPLTLAAYLLHRRQL
jgi:ABC-type transport system involved in multi-copper enzyme maturation permease subunit